MSAFAYILSPSKSEYALTTLVIALCVFATFFSTSFAAPLVNNNAGTWTDLYNDSLGVSTVDQTVVDGSAGVVKLVTGQSAGSFTTVRIKPPSFDAWKSVRLEGSWSAAADVRISLLDSANGDATIAGFQNLAYSGLISLAALDAATYPEIKIKVDLTAGAVSPVITSTAVEWNPISFLLIDKKAAAEVQAGQSVSYRIRYSTSFVAAKDLVVWDQLPNTAQTTVTYPQNFGQNDNPAFLSSTGGGQYTATALTVKGVNIPANSVYWDLGTVKEGTTDTLTFTIRSLNGTLDGTTFANTAHADAANASAVASLPTSTVIRSVPSPTLTKRAGTGIYDIGNVNFTRVNSPNTFSISASNGSNAQGRETMYEAVVYDNLSDLVGKMDPDFGGSGIPVTSISPSGGSYIANYTPPTGGPAFPAVVWNVGTMGPGASFNGAFTVKLLDSPPLPAIGEYTNTVCIDSARSRAPLRNLTPLCRDLLVKWPLDETPTGSFAKGDNLRGVFQINAGRDDDLLVNDSAPPGPNNPYLYTKPGGTFPYGLLVRNNGLSAMNHVVMLDKVPANTTFKSAWFTDPWLQANARIFYSLTDTANANTPPAYDYTQAPADLNPAGDTHWENYLTNPPANPALVKWVAFYIPAVNSNFFDSTSAGWIAGAPQRAVGYFDVNVSPTVLDPDPCTDKFLTNRALFRTHEFTPINGGPSVVLGSPLSAQDDEPTRVSIDKPQLGYTVSGSVTPAVLSEPGQLIFTTAVKNGGAATAPNTQVELKWPRVEVDGSSQYLSITGFNPGEIVAFDPNTGTIILSLGNLPPGAEVPVSLTVAVPAGVDFGSQLTFTSRATSAGAACPPPSAVTQASAVAEMRPLLRVVKNDVLDLIPSGGELDYRLTLYNEGKAPSHGTWVVDRMPAEMVFTEAYGPQGEQVWFSSADNLPPSFLTPFQPIDAAVIATRFSPGIRDDNGTPADPSDDVWTSPFGEQTRWVAWNMDLTSFSPPLYPVGQIHQVGFRVKNDLDGPGPGTVGSPSGTQIFNTAAVFSDELLQAIGNEVITTIKDAPSIIVQKTGPQVVSAGETFSWILTYYNNSGINDDIVTVTDLLPPGVEFLSASHVWNALALANGAPINNNGQPVATSVTANPDGSTSVSFDIAGSSGYRGDGTDLASLEGGTITITARVPESTPSGVDFLNRVTATATNGSETSSSSDEHLVLVRNAELGLTKFRGTANPAPGDTVTYTLIVRNIGLKAAANTVITDLMPANLTFVPGSTVVLTSGYSIGAPNIAGTTLSWSAALGNALTRAPLAPGVLPATSGDVVIQYKAIVAAGTSPGTILPNTATVTTDTSEDGTLPNEDTQEVTTPFPDPTVVKNGPLFVEPGGRFSWTLSYWNITRQPATGVYLIDTLPDYTGDGEADVTFIEQIAPAGVTAYYSSAPVNTTPAFIVADPTANGWSATPTSPVNHIAWLVGGLGAQAGPFEIAVTVDAIRPNGGSPLPLPAGVSLDNHVTIYLEGTDNNPANNADNHLTSTPGNDIALTKTGSTEGVFPGLAPGAPLTYTLTVSNSGTQVAYGVEIQDTLPAQLALENPGDNFLTVELTNAAGSPVTALDPLGDPITTTIPVTRVVNGATIRWHLGTTTESDALYYRKIGLPPGAETRFQIFTRVLESVGNGTPITNTATAILHNRDDSDPPEAVTTNNTDTSSTVVYLPDLALRKSVRDLTTFSEQWTEAGRLLEYRLDYNNLGYAPASNSVISEIVPEGTTLVSVNQPIGSTVNYYPGPGTAGATAFDVNLGTLNAPANLVGVPQNYCFGALAAIELAREKNGIPSTVPRFESSDQVGVVLTSIGDVNGDGIPDLLLGSPRNNDVAASSGGAWVILLNADGTALSAVELANGLGGIPSDSFLAGDNVGSSVASLGDIDGDGIPDIVLSARLNDDGESNAGGAWVILLNSNGTAKSAIELANGKNGIPANSFLAGDTVGTAVAAAGDIDGDGIPDLALGAVGNDDGGSNSGAVWIILLHADGTAKSSLELANGKNGVPIGRFPASAGISQQIRSLGDVDGDGVPDLVVSAPTNAEGGAGAGGAYVILLNNTGTAKSVVKLANGLSGIPAGSFQPGDSVGAFVSALGDINGDGIPDLALSATGNADGGTLTGGAWVILLNANGTAQSAIELANGKNGIPAGSFLVGDSVGSSVQAVGDIDGDGISDLLLGAAGNDDGGSSAGGAWVVLLNPDGTAKHSYEIANGKNGVPSGSFAANVQVGAAVAAGGDINGDGLPDLILSAHLNSSGAPNAGGAWVILSARNDDCPPGTEGSPLRGNKAIGGQLDIEFPSNTAKSATRLVNGLNGIPAGSFSDNDRVGNTVASAGDVDGDGIPDILLGASLNDDGGINSGGVWVVLLNADGTAKSAVELANDKNGIPANSFQSSDAVGRTVASVGDIDGDGIPDILLGAPLNDDGATDSGGAWIVLLNNDGTAKNAIKLANGINGIPVGSFLANDQVGNTVASIGDLDADGIPDIVLGAHLNDDGTSNSGGAWVILLNANGTAKNAIELANGKNGIPAGSFLAGDQVGRTIALLGDVDGDGISDILLGAYLNDDGASDAGGAWLILLNANGTAKNAIELANGKNGIPAGSFLANDQVGYSVAPAGDVDGDGIPDALLGAPNNDDGSSNAGGAWVVLLNANGTSKSAIELANGKNGIPAGSFMAEDLTGWAVATTGDMDGDGIPDVLISAHENDESGVNTGGAWLILLNADGTAKTAIELANGKNGVPLGSFVNRERGGYALATIGDLNGDGIPELLLGMDPNLAGSPNTGGSLVVFLNFVNRYYATGFTETILAGGSGLLSWDRLFSSADIPDSTSLTYTIGRLVNGVPTYDLGAQWTGISGPLPAAGLDLSSLTQQSLVARVDFVTTDALITPTLQSLFATYQSNTWPGFTFTVRVNEPVPTHVLPDIKNTAAISTDTPELQYSNNSASDDIFIRLADLAVVKSADKTAALETETITFTLDWRNNGPQDALNALLTDTLPAGLTFVSASPAPVTVTGQLLSWTLGDLAPGASGSVIITATVDPGTAGQTLVNTTSITNDRQETDYTNNQDDVPVLIGTLANVWITKDGPATASLGGPATFTLTYGNNGNNAAADVVITDLLPAGLTFLSANPSPDTQVGQLLTWNLGILTPGTSASITVTATVGTDFVSLHNQTLVNSTAITTTTPEVSLADNSDSHPITTLGAPAAIGGFVWHDLNKDGVIDPGESPLANVLITLTGTDVFGSPVTVAQLTGPDGSYSFNGLLPGTYQIAETQPTGYRSTADVLGTVQNLSNGINTDPLDDLITTIVLTSGDRGIQYNFGEISEAMALGSFIWEDANNNGLQDSGETGLAGVNVSLLVDDGTGTFIPAFNLSGNPVPNQTTGSSGTYFFGNLPVGDYRLLVAPPASAKPSAQQTTANNNHTENDSNISGPGSVAGTYLSGIFTLNPGDAPIESGLYTGDGQDNASNANGNMTVDFGFYRTASLGNFVWRDTNGNGIQDSGELGIEGVTVNLLDGTGTQVATTTTDSNGAYNFTGLTPGSYSVEFIAPTGNTFSPQNADSAGINGTVNSDANPTTGRTAAVTLVSGENNPNLDAGLYQPASLGNFVWHDTNGNGLQDSGELGIEGVTVNLLDGTGLQVATTTTDSNGAYNFTGLTPGSYSVEFIAPTGNTFSPQNADSAGTNGPANSDPNPTTGRTAAVTLVSGDNNPNLDAGLYQLASLGDFVWRDTNANGIQDSGELGIEGVTINLLDGTGTQVATTTTSASGFYSFTNLVPGTYSVEFVAPTAHVFSPPNADSAGINGSVNSDAAPTTGRTASVTLASGDNNPNLDAGLYQLASLGDFVWRDTNANGIQDSGELGIEGVAVNLLDGTGTQVATTTTNSSGFYTFTNLVPGTYSVEFVAPTAHVFSPPNADSAGINGPVNSDAAPTTGRITAVTLASGENNPNLDAGLYQPASLGDFVWRDTNANGIQDSGELGIAGVTVNLLDGTGTQVATTTTNSSGFYNFTNLVPGTYSVEFIAPTAHVFSPPNADSAGINGPVNSDAAPTTGRTASVTLTSGENNPNLDAGLYQPASLGDFVWRDTNANGIQDSGELGIAGVVVNLLDSDGNQVATTTTDVDGLYSFTGLAPGSYSVQFIAPSGNTFSPQNADSAGINGALNSDANPTTGRTPSVILVSGENNPNLDAGLYQPASLGNFVWRDTNGNGIQDTGELGIAGVVVNLLDGSGNPVLDGNGVAITTTTDSDGAYSFANLAPGSYSLEFIAPSGNTFSPQNADSAGINGPVNSDANPSTGRTTSVTLASGEQNPNLDAGLYQPASLGDLVWVDTQNFGIQDLGELGMAGVVVNLLDGSGNPVLNGGGVAITTLTGSTGFYQFTNLAPGSYSVQFIAPTGYLISPQDADNAGVNGPVNSDATPTTGRTASVTLASGENNPNLDAGLYQPARIIGTVTDDTTGDKTGNTPLSGVTLTLLDADGNEVRQTTTNTLGEYAFTDLLPGTYSVVETDPSSYLSLTPNTVASLTVPPAGTGEAHFVDTLPVSITGTVTWDTNGDGTGDTVVPGASLTLLDDQGNPVLDPDGKPVRTTTDANGDYAFTGLPPGQYTVVHQLEDGFAALTPSSVELDFLPPGTSAEAHFVITQTEDTSRIVYCYCLTTVDINPLRNVPPHHSGAWEVVSATSVNGFGRIRILSDGYIRYLPREDFLGDATDTIVVVLRAPDGTTITRRIIVNTFDSISGKFQSLLATEDLQNNSASPSDDPDFASMRGLINLNLSGSAVVSGKVRLEGETLSFRGPIRGAVSFVKTNSRHGKNRWDISVIYSDKTDSWDILLKKHGGETFVGTGIRALKASPALAGRYPTTFGATELGQFDFGSGHIIIRNKATVRLIGKLDGAQRSFTTSAAILQNQQIPFFQRSALGGSYRRISIGGVLFIDATNPAGWFDGNGWIKLHPTSTMGLATPDPRIPYDLWFQPQP